jgi:hypothetical protein
MNGDNKNGVWECGQRERRMLGEISLAGKAGHTRIYLAVKFSYMTQKVCYTQQTGSLDSAGRSHREGLHTAGSHF